MKLPKISIVTPSFNQGKYIEQTIISIIEQDYPNCELIVIDGGSTDNTLEVIKKYERYITYWVSELDNGQAQAINKGLVRATGDIINWINSDDILELGALKTIGEFFQNNSAKDVLCGYTRCFYDYDNSTSHIYRMGVHSNTTDTILQLEMNQPGTFYRTKVLRRLGGVNESLCYVFDNELWARYLCMYGVSGIGLTDATLAQFRLHLNSKSIGDGYEKFNQEQNSILYALAKQMELPAYILANMEEEKLVTYYENAPFATSYISRDKLLAFLSLKYLSKLYHQNNKALARQALLNVLKYNRSLYPFDRKHISILLKLMFRL